MSGLFEVSQGSPEGSQDCEAWLSPEKSFPSLVFLERSLKNRLEELLTHRSRETPKMEMLLCSWGDLLSFYQDLIARSSECIHESSFADMDNKRLLTATE